MQCHTYLQAVQSDDGGMAIRERSDEVRVLRGLDVADEMSARVPQQGHLGGGRRADLQRAWVSVVMIDEGRD